MHYRSDLPGFVRRNTGRTCKKQAEVVAHSAGQGRSGQATLRRDSQCKSSYMFGVIQVHYLLKINNPREKATGLSLCSVQMGAWFLVPSEP
jgi:hypothetical protein